MSQSCWQGRTERWSERHGRSAYFKVRAQLLSQQVADLVQNRIAGGILLSGHPDHILTSPCRDGIRERGEAGEKVPSATHMTQCPFLAITEAT